MLERHVQQVTVELLERFPAVALLGPRQCGKTTLAHAIADELGQEAVYLDLELPSDRAKLSDAELYLGEHEQQLVILDEIQQLPGITQVLRGLIDKRRRQGRRGKQFLLLGSASLDLLQQSAESLAGRIAYQELTPFLIEEVGGQEPDAEEDLWARGGFPDSFLAKDEQSSYDWRTYFIQTYLERDVPALGPRIPAETLRRFWQMLAHNQGQILNAAQIAGSLGVSGQTVARYLDIMVDVLLVRRLPPWASNSQKRLVKTPKVYVRDSGLVHALLAIRDREELLGHPVLGASWEGYVLENILNLLPANVEAAFYRTSAGAEIDLTIEWGPKERWAIEVKRSLRDPKPSRGFYNGCEDIGATRQFCIYPGKDSYPLDTKTQVMGISQFLKVFRSAGNPGGPARSLPKSSRVAKRA